MKNKFTVFIGEGAGRAVIESDHVQITENGRIAVYNCKTGKCEVFELKEIKEISVL